MWGGPKSWYYKTSNVKQPNQIPVFVDAAFFSVHPRNGDTVPAEDQEDLPFANVRSSGNSINRVFMNRHEGAVNMLLLDFSVEKVRLKKLFSYKWHALYNLNQDVPDTWPDWLARLPD